MKTAAPAHVGRDLGVGVVLLVFTTASFLLSRLPLGAAALPVALGIATVKAVLIAWFFMHLVEQKKSDALAIATALVMLGTLLTFTLLEVGTRFAPSVAPGPFPSKMP